MEQNEEWQLQHSYMPPHTMTEVAGDTAQDVRLGFAYGHLRNYSTNRKFSREFDATQCKIAD